jgi:hypothetical protein
MQKLRLAALSHRHLLRRSALEFRCNLCGQANVLSEE